MGNDFETFEQSVDWALKSVMIILDEINLDYMAVYITFFAIIAVMLLILLYSSRFLNDQENLVVKIPHENLNNIAKKSEQNLTFEKLKTNILLDHVKSLRELHIAAERCYIKKNELKCIQLTTYCPYMINVRAKTDGYTPFHRVCYHGCTVLMKFMVSKGANLSLRTYAGETPLGLAIQACIRNPTVGLGCVRILEHHGCVVNPIDKWYRIYLEAALMTRNQALAEWLFNQASLLGHRSASFPMSRI